KDGSKRYVTEVVADMFNGVQFLSKSNGTNSTSNNTENDVFNGMNFADDMTPVDDGDMPF
ncbi:MAG: single-stranded DNA-binding protein, partial [Peptostreptococcaceae bacterium]|nr:single-stranded DNA-binding protein [Peptostreptococcaceae bacterium]